MDVRATHNSYKTGVGNSNVHGSQARHIRADIGWAIGSGGDSGVKQLPRLHLTEAVFSAPAHYNYVGTCVSQLFKRSQKFILLGKTAHFKFGASVEKTT